MKHAYVHTDIHIYTTLQKVEFYTRTVFQPNLKLLLQQKNQIIQQIVNETYEIYTCSEPLIAITSRNNSLTLEGRHIAKYIQT